MKRFAKKLSVASTCLLALTTLCGVAPADVKVVGTGAAYAEIQDAVNAANDGDLILVRSGNYRPVTIDNKELSIASDTGAIVNVWGTVTVMNLTAHRTVVLAGLTVGGFVVLIELAASRQLFAMIAEDCRERVLVRAKAVVETACAPPYGGAFDSEQRP